MPTDLTPLSNEELDALEKRAREKGYTPSIGFDDFLRLIAQARKVAALEADVENLLHSQIDFAHGYAEGLERDLAAQAALLGECRDELDEFTTLNQKSRQKDGAAIVRRGFKRLHLRELLPSACSPNSANQPPLGSWEEVRDGLQTATANGR